MIAMMTHPRSRRHFLASSSVAASAGLFASSALAQSSADADHDGLSDNAQRGSNLRYCLNTSTINHSKVPVQRQIEIAASAGYDSVELWIGDVRKYTDEGGSLSDLRKLIEDHELKVDSAIAFGQWIIDDDEKRRVGLDQCRRDMEVVRELGGSRIAAPPSGATREAGLDLRAAGERYRALLEVGNDVGVTPQLELWGFSKNLSRLEEVLFVAAAAQHPDACLLLDVYHLYKGGSDFSNIDLVPASKMPCLHMNDYPADPPRESIGDKDRVYPGDGIAPMDRILSTLVANGFNGALSLELFNRDYWQESPDVVAARGLSKMKACVAKALG